MSLLHRHKKEQEKSSLIARTLAGTFFLICLGILLVITYISFSWATITITPQETHDEYAFRIPLIIEGSLSLSKDDEQEGISAEIRDIDVFEEENFPVLPQEEVKKPQKTHGIITLVNTTAKDQPLVATTRLAQPGGILFRTVAFVLAKAGQRVEVEVIADTQGAPSVSNDHFILLGLAPQLQKSIYGATFIEKSFQPREKGIITQQAVDEAKKIVHEKLEKKMQEKISELSNQYQGKKIITLPHEEEKEVLNQPVGERAADFKIKIEGTTHILILDEQNGFEFVTQKLKEQEAAGYSFSPLNKEDITYQFDQEADKKLHVKATIKVQKRLTSNQITVNKKNFVNKNAQEIRTALESYPDVSDIQVRFYPFWITRAPLLVDHIHVLVKE